MLGYNLLEMGVAPLQDGLDHERLLDRLREEVNAARESFDAAKDEFDRRAGGLVNTPDGRSSPYPFTERYNDAARVYGDALRRFASALHDLRLID